MILQHQFEILDDRFRSFIIENVHLEKLVGGLRWAEGGVWFGDSKRFLFSDIPNDRIMCWSEQHGVSVYRAPSRKANGQTRDLEGRLITCEHDGRQVTRTEHDGSISVLADSFEGKPLNSPNDVVVKSDGTIWFTDPPYGLLDNYYGTVRPQQQDCQHVFRLDPGTRDMTPVVSDFVRPNGLCFSPDETRLFVSDTSLSHDPNGNRHIRSFTVNSDHSLSGGDVFAAIKPGVSDGLRCDSEGYVWTSAGDGVHCYAPDGTLLGKILVPEMVANVTFGGHRKNRLFICASTSVYAIYLRREGCQIP